MIRSTLILLALVSACTTENLCTSIDDRCHVVELITHGAGGAIEGSAVVIDDHHVLTAAHVVKGADHVVIKDQNGSYVGHSRDIVAHLEVDLAIVGFPDLDSLPPATLSAVPVSARVGERVILYHVEEDRVGELLGSRRLGEAVTDWTVATCYGDSGSGVFSAADGALVSIHTSAHPSVDGRCVPCEGYSIDVFALRPWIEAHSGL